MEKPVYLPLSELLDLLREDGFVIGIENYIAMKQVLADMGDRSLHNFEKLKERLCPVFATNKEQQEAFYAIFDRLFLLEKIALLDIDHEKKSARPIESKIPANRGPFLLIGFLVVLVISVIAAWLIINEKEKAQKFRVDSAKNLPNVPPPPVQPQETIINPATPDEKRPANSGSGLRYLYMMSPDISAIEATWGQRFHSTYMMIGLVVMFTLFGFFLVYEYYNWYKSRLIARVRKLKDPVVSWPLHMHEKIKISFSRDFFAIAKGMRMRVAQGTQVFDMIKTVNESVRQGGRLEPQYKTLSRPADFLVLIDSANHMQTAYFDYLLFLLKKNDIHLIRFFYDSDLRKCSNELYPAGVTLQYLQYHYAESRLLIFGDAHCLTIDNEAHLQPWADVFRSWKDSFIFSTAPVNQWSQKENVLAEDFVILPAGIAGMMEMVDYFEYNKFTGPDLREMPGYTPDLNAGPQHLASVLRLYFYENNDNAVHTQLMMQWVAACCILPELFWNLILYLGKILSTEDIDLLSFENLEMLASLQWFKEGTIPENCRKILLEDKSILSEQIIKRVSHKILEVLKENLPEDKNQLAYDNRQMQIVVLELMQDPESRLKQKLLTNLKNSQAITKSRDYLVLQKLNTGFNRNLDFIISSNIKHILFKDGLVFKGLKTYVTAFFVLICLSFFYINLDFKLLEGENVVYESKTYYLDNPQKRAAFYTHLAAWSHNYNYPPLFFKGSLTDNYLDSAIQADSKYAPALLNTYVLNYNYGYRQYELGHIEIARQYWNKNRELKPKIERYMGYEPLKTRALLDDSLMNYKRMQDLGARLLGY